MKRLYYFEERRLALPLPAKAGSPRALNFYGNQQLNLGRYEEALSSYLTVVGKELGPNPFVPTARLRIIESYYRIGSGFEFSGNHVRAILNYESALESMSLIPDISDPLPDYFSSVSSTAIRVKLGPLYLRLGDMLANLKRFEVALESYNRAIHYASNIGGNSTASKYRELAFSRLDTLYLAWGQELETEAFSRPDPEEQALLELQAQEKYDRVISNSDNQTALSSANRWAYGIGLRQGDRELGAGNFEKAVTVYRGTFQRYSVAQIYINNYLSRAYLLWGQKLNAEGKYEEALGRLEPNLMLYPSGQEITAYRLAIE